MKWFRFYNEAYRDPKVQLLRPEIFRFWVNFLCVASESEPRGIVASEAHLKLALGVDGASMRRWLGVLEARALLHRRADGALIPHNWEGRQKPSDDAAIRKRDQRGKGCVNPENAMSRDTSQDTSQDKNVTPLTGTRALREEGEGDREESRNPLPLIESLGPEYKPVGELAIELGGDLSWGAWVNAQGRFGHAARWIELALQKASGAGKLHKPYVAKILQDWAAEGGPPKATRNGTAPKPAPVQVTAEEKAAAKAKNEASRERVRQLEATKKWTHETR